MKIFSNENVQDRFSMTRPRVITNNMEQGYKLWKMEVTSSSGIFKTSSHVSYLLLLGKRKSKNSLWMISLTLKYAPSF